MRRSWRRTGARAALLGLAAGLWPGQAIEEQALAQGPFCPGTHVELEPNDTPGSATSLTLSAFSARGITGAIGTPGDQDYYRVTTTANGDRLLISIDTGLSSDTPPFSRDTVVSVYQADGTTLMEEDDDDGTANGLDHTVESQDASAIAGLLLPTAGTYVIRVRAKSAAAQIATYVMLIGISRGSGPEMEPNDTPPGTFMPFATVDGTLSGPGDVDYYPLNVLDAGQPFVGVDGDPERDGTGTDVVLDFVDPFPPFATVLHVDSSGSVGSPAPPAESALDRAVPPFQKTARISGPAAGTYRISVMWTGYCAVPVVLEKLDIE